MCIFVPERRGINDLDAQRVTPWACATRQGKDQEEAVESELSSPENLTLSSDADITSFESIVIPSAGSLTSDMLIFPSRRFMCIVMCVNCPLVLEEVVGLALSD